MTFYADTSFLTSFLLVDSNYGAAKRLMQTLNPKCLLTQFGAVELKNAIWSAVFRKALTISDARVVLRQVESEIHSGYFSSTSCSWENVFHEAEDLSQRHTHFIGCRALDIMHVATAVVLGCTDFLTFDQRQARLAQQAGLTTHP